MKTVLIVEDSFFGRLLLKDILTQNGYIVIAEAKNGDEAIDKYEQYLPDILIMDITVPEFNGVEATKIILKSDPEANILVLNEPDQKKDVIFLLKYGIKGYILKPINPGLFLETVNKTR